jgi:succinylglutamate desuccinylase
MLLSEQYKVELVAPDISMYKNGNTGVDFVHTFDSGKPGPHVMINAVIHGNEICGAITLDLFFKNDLRPVQGKLTLCFVNPAAYASFDPARPSASRFVDEDMNRVWTEEQLDGPKQSVELNRARALRPFYDEVDYLLDIHSMGTLSAPIMLCHGLDKERKLARDMRYPRTVACGSGHVIGRRLIEYTPFNDRSNGKTALLIECGQHWAKETGPVAIDTALHYLRALEIVPKAFFDAHVSTPEPEPQWFLEVTDGYAPQSSAFSFVEDFKGLEVFPQQGTVIAIDDGKEVRTPYDDCVLVMPNHSARQGQRAMRLARQIS